MDLPLAAHDVKDVTVLWLGRIGDLIVSTPALRSLRRLYPKAHIRLVLSGLCEQLAPLIPFKDEAIFARRVQHPMANLKLAAALVLRKCDLLVDLNPSASRTSATLASLIRAPVKIGFKKGRLDSILTHRLAPPGEREPMLQRYRRLAEALGADYEPRPELSVPAEAEAEAEALMKRVSEGSKRKAGASLNIIIHPGNFKKIQHRWPEEKFVRLTNKLLADPSLRIHYLAGPGEAERVRAIVSKLKSPVPILGPVSLGVTAAVMRRMDLAVLNVTGTLHLAAAVGTPTFAFHSGYTDAVWRPLGPKHTGCVSPSWKSCREISFEEAASRLNPLLENLRSRKICG